MTLQEFVDKCLEAGMSMDSEIAYIDIGDNPDFTCEEPNKQAPFHTTAYDKWRIWS